MSYPVVQKKKIKNISICHLLKILLSTQSANIYGDVMWFSKHNIDYLTWLSKYSQKTSISFARHVN